MNKLVLPLLARDLMNDLMELYKKNSELRSLIAGYEVVEHNEEEVLYDALLRAIVSVKQSNEVYENVAKKKGLL